LSLTDTETHWRHRVQTIVVLGLVGIGAGAAAAQASNDTLKLTFDLGYVKTGGNTDVTTLNFGENLGYVTGRWTLSHQLVVIEGRTQGVETAALYATGGRVDRALSARLGAYVLGGYDRNVFAGIARRFQEGVGLKVNVIATASDPLTLEGGLSLIQQRSTADVRESFRAGTGSRLVQARVHRIGIRTADARAAADLQNSTDRRVNGETSLVAPLSKHVALKVVYGIRFDNRPQPGFKKTDTAFTTGIQIAL
jgi:putative salt-induced outer membrane protein